MDGGKFRDGEGRDGEPGLMRTYRVQVQHGATRASRLTTDGGRSCCPKPKPHCAIFIGGGHAKPGKHALVTSLLNMMPRLSPSEMWGFRVGNKVTGNHYLE